MEDGTQYSENALPTKSNTTIYLVLAILVVLGGYYFLSQKPSPSTTMTTTQSSPASASAVAIMEGDVKVFTLEGGSFYYKPNMIEVKKGDKVKVVINSVSMMHDFVIDELDVKSEMAKSGSSTTVEFTASKVGRFEFYCSVGQHRAQGMVGTFVVTE